LIREQDSDEHLQKLWKIAKDEDKSYANERELTDAQGLIRIKGILVKKETTKEGEIQMKVVVPASLQYQIIVQAHNSSHAGVNGTYALIRQYHWFRGMKPLVRDVVRHCPKCLARKGRPIRREVLAPDDRPRVLGERWHLDGLELPKSGVYNHLIVAIDGATKYVILKQATGETARAACDVLMEIVRRFGRPQRVVSDRGTAFTSKAFEMTCNLLGIKYTPIATGQPQANGMVERENRTILDALSIACRGEGSQWAKVVGEVEYILNTRISNATGHSPYELVYGRLPPGPIYIDTLRNWEHEVKGKEKLENLKRRIEFLQQGAFDNQEKASITQQRFHNQHAQSHSFHVAEEEE